MVTDEQVRRLMRLRKTEKTKAAAAAKAGMDEKTARRWAKAGVLPSRSRPERNWRTRSDPFAEVWSEIEGILKRAPTVEATTVLEHLSRLWPGRFESGQVRTLQRRIKRWKATEGTLREVMFAQQHRPGEQSQSDFTRMGKIRITIGGEPFDHLLYHFVLTYSNWEAVTICFSESFESLSAGLQNALWRLGAVPAEHRTDSLSAAVHQLGRVEEFTDRCEGLLRHYGMRASHTQAGRAHENGDVEQSHHRFKRALEQELLLRESGDFASVESYQQFLEAVVERRNRSRERRVKEELEVMRRLPNRRLEDFTKLQVPVSRGATIRVRKNTYSVDSRLIDETVEVRLYPGHLEVFCGQRKIEELPRLRGEGKHRIEYRHVIHSLVRKPGAFERYRYRSDLFPNVLFRTAWDELREECPGRAEREYLRILELAADEGQDRIEQSLKYLIESGQRIRAESVEALLTEAPLPAWEVNIAPVEVSRYDELLCAAREALR